MRRTYRFTERWLARLLPPEDAEQIEYWDAAVPGLHVVVRNTGLKSYYLRHKGRRRKLGEVMGEGRDADRKLQAGQALQLEDARAQALELRSSPQLRIRARSHSVETVADLYAEWRKQRGPKLKASTLATYSRSIDANVLPVFGKMRPEEITADDLLGWIESIGEDPPFGRGAPVQANRAKAHFSSILGWASKRRLIKVNPMAGVEWRYEEKKKQTVFNSRQIRALWHYWEASTGLTAKLFQLTLATCQRPGEVASMRWDDLDTIAGGAVWTIEDPKNETRHYVPLESLALEVIEVIRPVTGFGTYVFPHRFDPERHLASWNKEMERARMATRVDSFDAHSLRRTGASIMETLGVSRDVIRAILNHVPGGATSHYVYAQGASPACRTAIAMLEEHLRQCVRSAVVGRFGEVVGMQDRPQGK